MSKQVVSYCVIRCIYAFFFKIACLSRSSTRRFFINNHIISLFCCFSAVRVVPRFGISSTFIVPAYRFSHFIPNDFVIFTHLAASSCNIFGSLGCAQRNKTLNLFVYPALIMKYVHLWQRKRVSLSVPCFFRNFPPTDSQIEVLPNMLLRRDWNL